MGKRIKEIDVLYMLGIVCVVLGHSHSSNWNTFSGTILESLIQFIYTFHMQLFFSISGFLLMHSTMIGKNSFFISVKKKIKRLLVPYAIISLLAILPKGLLKGDLNGSLFYDINNIIFYPRRGVLGHFWFMPVVFVLYAIFILWKICIPKKRKYAYFVITGIVTLFIYYLPYSTDFLMFNDLKKFMFFFYFGMMIYVFKEHWNISIPIYVKIFNILTAIFLGCINVKHPIQGVELLVSMIMVIACWQLATLINGKNKFVVWISKHNFTFYIYGWPFQGVIGLICDKFTIGWKATSICMFIAGMIGPTVIIIVYEKFKFIQNRFLGLILGMK